MTNKNTDFFKQIKCLRKSAFVLYQESHADFPNRENTLHTNLLHKFGAEQINGKPQKKVKVIANYKAFRFVL